MRRLRPLRDRIVVAPLEGATRTVEGTEAGRETPVTLTVAAGGADALVVAPVGPRSVVHVVLDTGPECRGGLRPTDRVLIDLERGYILEWSEVEARVVVEDDVIGVVEG